MDSCLFDPCLINIPKGQMIHLRRNCTNQSTFIEQETRIGEKFIHKGYNENFIEEKINEVLHIQRDDLIKDKQRKVKYQEVPKIIDYNTQHQQVERIFKKHWSLLLADDQLWTILPRIPNFVYRKAPILRDVIAKNGTDLPKNRRSSPFFRERFFFHARDVTPEGILNKNGQKCTKFTSTSNKKEYKIKDFISCRTEGVVYILQCRALCSI